MPGPAPRFAALLWALLLSFASAAAAVATGLWLRSRHRRDEDEGGDP
ncbi:hypothetical protein ACFWBF_06525 [Streptomyces sp. NPDC060028]